MNNNSTIFAVVKRYSRDGKCNIQKSEVTFINKERTECVVPYQKLINKQRVNVTRLVLVNSTNSRFAHSEKYGDSTYVTEVYDDFGITVRIEFAIPMIQLDNTNDEVPV